MYCMYSVLPYCVYSWSACTISTHVLYIPYAVLYYMYSWTIRTVCTICTHVLHVLRCTHELYVLMYYLHSCTICAVCTHELHGLYVLTYHMNPVLWLYFLHSPPVSGHLGCCQFFAIAVTLWLSLYIGYCIFVSCCKSSPEFYAWEGNL